VPVSMREPYWRVIGPATVLTGVEPGSLAKTPHLRGFLLMMGVRPFFYLCAVCGVGRAGCRWVETWQRNRKFWNA
jgi:hypothetical protein